MKYLKMLGLAAVAAMALMAIGVGTATATTLEVGGVAQTGSVTLVSTLKSNTSAVLKDEFGTTTDTCTTSEVHGETVSPFTGASVSGPITTLSFGNCTHTTTVIKSGSLSVAWIEGTTNGTVTSKEAEVTVQSTFFGASAICKTGSGTDIGTLTGVTKAQTEAGTLHATMDINAKINCGILGTSSWTGTYTVTSPTDLGVIG